MVSKNGLVKPKFPFPLKKEMVQGKLVVTPEVKNYTPEQKVAYKKYIKEYSVYKKNAFWASPRGKAMSRLREHLSACKKRIFELENAEKIKRDTLRVEIRRKSDELKAQRALLRKV